MNESWLQLAWLAGGMLAALVAITAALTFLPAAFIKRRHRVELAARCRGRLVLSYDDGPGIKLTPPLLELLRRHDAKVSFYLLGFRAQRHPECCDLIAAAGHDIGCHTHWHRHAWRTLPWTAVIDMLRGYESMARWLEPRAAFRPPFGKLTTWTWLASRRRGIPLAFWTHDGCDTHAHLPDPATVAQRIVDAGGAVVLLHSHDRGEERHEFVLRITEELLRRGSERGLRICTMSEIMADTSSSRAGSAVPHLVAS